MAILHDYRRDIDGLRAIAVSFVVFYHLGIGSVTGGFVGVDVFFVISGFLITAIIRRDLKQGAFSLMRFYDRRVRRIVPALAAVTVASLVAGYYLLLPGDYAVLADQAICAVFGVSNFFFLSHTGYFVRDATMMPLLQTWSLGVEEQFYLVWPLLLVAIAASARNGFRIGALVLGAMVALSLALSIYYVSFLQHQITAFYMLPMRAWELGLGALIVYAPELDARWKSELCAGAGIISIAASAFLLTNQSPFPGINAIYPSVGAAMVIAARSERTIVAKTLSLGPLVGLGLISYSLYLWHWPLLVFYRYYKSAGVIASDESTWLLVAAVAISYLSWRFIEQPFRKPRWSPRRTVPAGFVVCASVAAVSAAIAGGGGLPQRIPRDLQSMQNLNVMWAFPCNGKVDGLGGCVFGAEWETAHKKVFLWGDSHADHLAPLLKAVYAGTDTSVVLYDGCAPMIGGSVRLASPPDPQYNSECHARHVKALRYLQSHPEVSLVVLAGRWAEKLHRLYPEAEPNAPRSVAIGQLLMTQGLTELIESTSMLGRSYVLVGPVPYWQHDPVQCVVARSSGLYRSSCAAEIPSHDFWAEHEPIHRSLDAVEHSVSHVSVVVPGRGLCAGANCISWVAGEFLYRDIGHFRRNMRPETNAQLANLIGLTDALREPNLAARH